jgi:hypothetical protein
MAGIDMGNTLHPLLGMDRDETEKEKHHTHYSFSRYYSISGVGICERLHKKHRLHDFL